MRLIINVFHFTAQLMIAYSPAGLVLALSGSHINKERSIRVLAFGRFIKQTIRRNAALDNRLFASQLHGLMLELGVLSSP